MTVIIELSPEIEAGLSALAAARGLAIQDYVQRLLQEQVPLRAATNLTPAERADIWRESSRGLPLRPPLSDEAIGRDTIYDARG